METKLDGQIVIQGYAKDQYVITQDSKGFFVVDSNNGYFQDQIKKLSKALQIVDSIIKEDKKYLRNII